MERGLMGCDREWETCASSWSEDWGGSRGRRSRFCLDLRPLCATIYPMRHLTIVLGLGLVSATPAFAETCPAASDHTAAFDALLAEMAEVDGEMAARDISNKMWELWTDAPDERAQGLLDRGMSARSSYDFLGAYAAFDMLVEYCPDYAEGYNQRAFVSYLREDFAAALVDLDRALERSPRHVGALSGKALSLLALGRRDEARDVLQAALALNPGLSERHLAGPGGPLAPEGRDL